MVSTSRKISFHRQEYVLSLKNWFPLISVTVSASRKNISSKVDGFHYRENPVPLAGMKDSFKNTFPLDVKKLSLAGASSNI